MARDALDFQAPQGEWNLIYPPNIPVLATSLRDEVEKYLWDCIEIAKKEGVDHTSRLAGNISSSLLLKDKDNVLIDEISPVVASYVQDFLMSSAVNRNIFSFEEDVDTEFCLEGLWVNFQRKHEFNPVHEHTGILSFVIWMNIPTDAKEQHNLPISKRSNNPMASNFVFYYQNLLGEMCEHRFELDKSANGKMVLFPATLQHCVYPFYDCEEERVSISGNLKYRRLESSE